LVLHEEWMPVLQELGFETIEKLGEVDKFIRKPQLSDWGFFCSLFVMLFFWHLHFRSKTLHNVLYFAQNALYLCII